MFLSLIIPCYNEAENLPLLIPRLLPLLEDPAIEIILVNNGSTDTTRTVLEKGLPHCNNLTVIHLDKNKGYGGGILAGLHAATGEHLGWTHADLQTDPADILQAITIIKNSNTPGPLFIKGARNGRSLLDKLFTVGMSIFETMYLKKILWDINAQPNVFHRSFFETWKDPPQDFSLDLYALYMAKRLGLRIIRFPVHFGERACGRSHWNTGIIAKWKFIKRTLQYSHALKKGISK